VSILKTDHEVRPARLDDAEAVCALCNAWSMSVRGVSTHDAVEQRVDWQSPGFDIEGDTRLAHNADGTLVGYASVWDTEAPHVRVGSFLRVHPKHGSAELEETLLDWLESRARRAIDRAPTGARVVLSAGSFSEDEGRADLLKRRGFVLVRHFVRLRKEMEALPEQPQPPSGISIRTFDRALDLRPAVLAVREAFRDHWGHVEGDLEEEIEQWRHWTHEDPDFDPSVWHLACDGDEIVGASFGTTKRPEADNLAYIYVLGVRGGWRGRGVARALLQHSFRTFFERGRPVVDLDADAANLTGAMRLYEGVGMRQIWRDDAYEKELRPGKDLSRKTLDH